MSAMEATTVIQPGAPADAPGITRADAIGNDGAEKAYGDRHFKPVITPGLLKSPILPVWLSKRFRRKETPATP
jgi:hypothetical protein